MAGRKEEYKKFESIERRQTAPTVWRGGWICLGSHWCEPLQPFHVCGRERERSELGCKGLPAIQDVLNATTSYEGRRGSNCPWLTWLTLPLWILRHSFIHSSLFWAFSISSCFSFFIMFDCFVCLCYVWSLLGELLHKTLFYSCPNTSIIAIRLCIKAAPNENHYARWRSIKASHLNKILTGSFTIHSIIIIIIFTLSPSPTCAHLFM